MSSLEYLYVIEFGNGTIKVGRSANIEHRISSHKTHGEALSVPVRRVWVSDAHEDSVYSESRLLQALGTPSHGKEWFRAVMFDDAVRAASDAVQLSTQPELYNKRLVEAKRLVELHTGRRININPVQRVNDVVKHFLFDPERWMMSSTAFSHYRASGGGLLQKEFISALEKEGVKRKRCNEGTRLIGIYISE